MLAAPLTGSQRVGEVLAPSPGTWIPRVSVGQELAGGELLGLMRQAGRWRPVILEGAGGCVEEVLPPYRRVECESILLSFGDAVEREEDSGEVPPEGVEVVLSPMSGTLYLQPHEGASPYAPEGTTIGARDTLALVEVMKTLTPVKAERAGRVERWLCGNGEPVERGCELVWIRGD